MLMGDGARTPLAHTTSGGSTPSCVLAGLFCTSMPSLAFMRSHSDSFSGQPCFSLIAPPSQSNASCSPSPDVHDTPWIALPKTLITNRAQNTQPTLHAPFEVGREIFHLQSVLYLGNGSGGGQVHLVSEDEQHAVAQLGLGEHSNREWASEHAR